jgi:hypothetical protein
MPKESAARDLRDRSPVSAVASEQAPESSWISRRTSLWIGWILTAMPIVLLAMGAVMVFAGSPQMLDEFVNRFGYRASFAPILGVLELACVILYAIPRTAVLGAIVMTGYLGGAIATHVRIGDPSFLVPLGLAVIVWGGLYFRDERLRALLPIRRAEVSR